MEIFSRVPLMKRKNLAAFSNELVCPHPNGVNEACGGKKWRFVENITPFKIRYRCKKCNRTVLYDFTNNPIAVKEVYGKKTDSVIRDTLWKYRNVFKR